MTEAARAIDEGGKIEAVAMSVGYRRRTSIVSSSRGVA
jgi:hypothetical protein